MGVPKFYRWLSERYPLINQAIHDGIRPEFDCMYLDMNGIIHVATHGPGTDPSKPLSESVAIANVFKYIDKVVRLGRPKRLLYMCLDGVAPRAKMNQQRQRRFRAAQERAQIREDAIRNGDLSEDAELFDSNCITPGTTFMAHLTKHLQFFIRKKIEEDPLWQQFTVLFSGHEVPGEAEHKIARYIRNMKSNDGYDGNTRHLLYGLDADLIFLSLATHEPHFALLREEVVFGIKKFNDARPTSSSSGDDFQLLDISILRECLEYEFRQVDIPFGFDLQRVIDDWIFLAFFVGNDFVPHLPSMDIHHGCLDRLVQVYKSLLPKLTGYITDSGSIDFERLELLIHRMADFEDEVLEMEKDDREKHDKRRGKKKNGQDANGNAAVEVEDESDPEDLQIALQNLQFEEESLADEYYQEKWGHEMDDPEARDALCRSYVEGLQWVLHYYYQGTPSWEWYYPYFYAPLASSLKGLSRYKTTFRLGEPFLPFEQLLGVLPPASGPLIPRALADLMTRPDSPIIDFYPTQFEVDMNGKRNDWEGIAMIPFVDQHRLIEAIRALPPSVFSEEERQRNSHGIEITFSYDPNFCDFVPSTISEIFTSITKSHCRVEKAVTPEIPGDGVYRSRLCADLVIPAPSFPHLSILNITMALAPVGVNVFGRESKRDSLVATIVPDPTTPSLRKGRAMIGKPCVVDWPFLRDAMVVAVSDGTARYEKDADEAAVQLSQAEVLQHQRDAANDRMKMLSARAVDIGDDRTRLEVRLFTGMGRAASGSVHKVWSDTSTFVPIQLVASRRQVRDPRFKTSGALSIKDAFPLGCPVVFVGTPPSYYGAGGTVLSHDSMRTATIQLNILDKEGAFGSQICEQMHAKDKWLQSFKIAKALSISTNTLGKISSGQLVAPGKVNIGLNFKFPRRQLMVPGYTRIVTQPARLVSYSNVVTEPQALWEYSSAAFRILQSYVNEFPEIFTALEENHERVVDLRPFVQGDVRDYIDRVSKWLKSLPSSRLPMVPCSSKVLSPDCIAAIEEAQLQCSRSTTVNEMQLQNVPMEFLYKPAPRVQWSPTEKVSYSLGDRVLFLGGHHGVPFGSRGNIIGIHSGGS
ncbi:hypothetical protein PBRA_002939 [Plasmodiophora brassicae]|uniref:Uncharacterized protein n=1 Tax=Plasmodiophora brassicae TaxID=37360 RepID=A0A0G4J757_PLABS|nr:hypothetical protein PBRA_002939 [Plasmodiophora brassicae]